MKRILILGASRYYARNFKLLADAGFEVYAVDKNPKAYGVSMVHRFAPIDVCEPRAVLEYVKKESIDGIMTVNEFGIRTAAYVADKLNLPGITPESANLFSDKGAMRQKWKEAELPQPDFQIVSSLSELEKAVKQIGLPCVLKPTDCGGGGRGISVIKTSEDIEWAYGFAAPYAKNRFIVEAFLEGTELSIETFSLNGKPTILGISDKVKPELRTRVATSLNYWADLSDKQMQNIEQLVEKALLVLGLKNGMGHTEVIMTKEGPMLVESSPRGGGGHIFHTLIETVSGINAPVEFARLLTGMPVNLPPVKRRGGVYRFFNPPSGLLKAVHHLEQAQELPGVLDIGMMKEPGDRVGYLENSLERAGYLVTEGNTRNDAVAIADKVENMLIFEVERL